MVRNVCIAALLVCSAAAAAAQQPPPETTVARPDRAARAGQAPPDAADPGSIPEVQLAAMLDTYAIVQAQSQLGIPDDKYGTFAARLKKLQDVRRKNMRMRRQIVQELRRLAGARAAAEGTTGDEAAIKKQLLALRELDERAAVELRQAYDSLDEVLDARQQARFRIFEEQIERRKLDLLLRAQERARANKR
jgi:hypothetical protein